MFDKLMKKNSYGCLRYSSTNIGDEIQSVAAMRFLPQIDYYIPRERVDEFHSDHGEKVKLFMNAWWMWEKKHFPPSEDIDPIFLSFHLREAFRNDTFMRDEVVEYLKKHGPIGCRDTGTAAFLQKYGIDAYFTGCLTMTLLPNQKIKEKKAGDYIVCVDVPEYMEQKIRKRADKPVYNISRMIFPIFKSVDRMTVAKILLYVYHNAACIVTPRLHVGLPGIAFGTPVCMLTTDKLSDGILKRRGRFAGLEGVFNEIKVENYMINPSLYDINNPPENPNTHYELRDQLVEKAAAATGFDSKAPVFDDDFNPFLELVGLLAYDKKNFERLLRFAKPEQLIDALHYRVNEKKSRHDLTY
ncbi:MAG: polysaccharide pyruvyl transferase family protein [Eubacterium sp.]|jgi:hypothetical protein|uniref:polysaccharide pyruvyl transferase family protein n=1 Tax=Eubacterium sp. F2 TaxID=3381348 RepID=UPI0039082AA8|nr:polysaccharide pyruvyl transferase family protein [Eubacterium sp.]MCI2197752.1 polysaccharide pyruvyl transferase family protein [Eubacterium sp.]